MNLQNIEFLKPTGIFTNYIYKAIPLVFDESMSYYETLLGLLAYLKNTVIPTVNNNAEAVAELQKLFTELKDFVDNYFDNLDVQQEINNKLDQMVQDGTLDNILNNYINVTKVYNTHQELIQDTGLVNNMKVKTLGYYEINDGGGAYYYITNILDDNSYQESLNSELYAELILSDGIINVKQLGSKGDGITDNTDIFNLIFSKFNTIYIPDGTYITNSIQLTKNNQTIFGNQRRNPIIKLKDNISTNSLFDLSNVINLEIHDILFDGNKSNSTINNSILYCERNNDQISHYLYNITVQNSSKNGIFYHGLSLLINNLTSNYCDDNGIYLRVLDSRIIRLTSFSSGNNGIYIQGSNNTITDCFSFFSNSNKDYSTAGIFIEGSRNNINGLSSQDNLNGAFINGNNNLIGNLNCDIIGNKELSSIGDINSSCLNIIGNNNIINATMTNTRYGDYKNITHYIYKINGNYNQLNYTIGTDNLANGDLLYKELTGLDNRINGDLYKFEIFLNAKYTSKYGLITNKVQDGNFSNSSAPWEGGYRENTTQQNNIMTYTATGAYGGLAQKITTLAGKKYFCKIKGKVSYATFNNRTISFIGQTSKDGQNYEGKVTKYFTQGLTEQELYFILDSDTQYSKLFVYTQSLAGQKNINVELSQFLMYEIPEDWYYFSADTINELINFRNPDVNDNYNVNFGV